MHQPPISNDPHPSEVHEPQPDSHLHMPEDHMEALYASQNPMVRYVHQNRLAAIVNELPQGTLKILDAGCGEGHLLEACYKKYPQNEYYGVDITDVALEKARERCPAGQFKKADLANTGFPDHFFDVVTCTEVIEHIIGYGAVLDELKRLLKKNGFLIITFPNEFLWTISRFVLRRNPIKVPDHVNEFNPSIMRSLMNLPIAKQLQLPFNMPFAIALGSLMKFKK